MAYVNFVFARHFNSIYLFSFFHIVTNHYNSISAIDSEIYAKFLGIIKAGDLSKLCRALLRRSP